MASTLARATLTLAIMTFLGTLTGFGVQIISAHYFGASKEVDAFVVSFALPFIIYSFANDSFTIALIYVLTKNKIKKNNFNTIASALFTLLIPVLLILVILILLTAPQLSRIIAPGFDKEGLSITTTMIRISAVVIFFMGATTITTGFLYLQNHFATPALLRFFIGAGTITTTVLLNKNYGIYSLAIGAAVGSGIAFLSQIIALTTFGFKYHFPKALPIPLLKNFMRVSLPLWIATIFFYSNRSINNAFASLLVEGTVSTLNYAYAITSFPLIISSAIATAIFPQLTALHNHQEHFSQLLSKTLRTAVFLLLPITVIFIILREPIITILLQRGRFDATTAIQTASAFAIYSIGLCAAGCYPLIANALSACGKMKQRMYLMFTLLSLNTTFNFVLIRYSAIGLALANVTAQWIALLFGAWLLKPTDCDMTKTIKQMMKLIIAITPPALFLLMISPIIKSVLPLIAATIITGGIYLYFANIVHIKEMTTIVKEARTWLLSH